MIYFQDAFVQVSPQRGGEDKKQQRGWDKKQQRGWDKKQQRGWDKNILAQVKNEPLINMFDEWFVFL